MRTPIDRRHLESSVEADFRKRVRALGGWTTKITSMEAGLPDRLVLLPGGRMYLVELKADTGSLDPLQKVWHERARNLGTRVYVVRGHEGVKRWLRHVTEGYATEARRRERRARRVDLSDAGEM